MHPSDAIQFISKERTNTGRAHQLGLSYGVDQDNVIQIVKAVQR